MTGFELAWKRSFCAVCSGLSWFNIAKEWVNAHTVNMITAGLYKICTQILIRSINSASAVSDKLGHSRKAGLLGGGFTLRRNTHSCCWDTREDSRVLKRRRGGWTRQQNRGSLGCIGTFLKRVFFFLYFQTKLRLRIGLFFPTSALWHLSEIIALYLFLQENESYCSARIVFRSKRALAMLTG